MAFGCFEFQVSAFIKNYIKDLVKLLFTFTFILRYIYLPDNIYSVEDNAAGKGLMSAIVEGVIIQTFLWNKVLKMQM